MNNNQDLPAFDPNDPKSTVWEAMFGQSGKAETIDTPEFRTIMADYYIGVQDKNTRGWNAALNALIAHIDARIAAAREQALAEAARECALVDLSAYKGSKDSESIGAHYVRIIRALKSTPTQPAPVAGWVSVEKDAARYRWLREADELDFDLMSGDMVGGRLDAAIDAAMSAPPAPVVTPTQQEQS